VSRRPTEREVQAIRALLAETPSRQEAWEDMLWALLNSAEFSFNH